MRTGIDRVAQLVAQIDRSLAFMSLYAVALTGSVGTRPVSV